MPNDGERAEIFTRLLGSLQEGVFVGLLTPATSGLSQTLVANPAVKRLLGLPADTPESEVDPFAPARFADPAARASFLDRLTSEGRVSNYLLRMRRADDTTRLIDVTAHVRATERGGVLVDALLRDVTEHRRMDDRSRELYQQLLQSEKLAAIGQMVSSVAHELNNPLATILGWAERLQETPLNDAGKRGVDVIQAESERAARIVRNLLTFSRRPSTRAMVDLNKVVRDTLALKAYEEPTGDIATVTALAAGLPKVFADVHQMQQVLLNLTSNAEQAMLTSHGRGTLVIRTWHDPTSDTVALEVSDDGPGLSAEIKSRIFEPFFTTKEKGKGTGLGLTVVYAIVQEHSGRIRVDSEPGRGTTFVVELPADVTTAAPHGPSASREEAKGRRVLVVEEERALAEATGEGLTHAGFTVDIAGDGEEALARVRQAQYDVLICDLKMPRVSGTMLYRAIAVAAPTLARRVIFVTGDATAPDAERFLADSGCTWLVKPVRMADLVRAVRDTLA
jgi:signal transduction histidine kinase